MARKSHETQCPIARGLHDLAIRYLRAGRSLIGMAFAMEDVHKWQGVSTEAQWGHLDRPASGTGGRCSQTDGTADIGERKLRIGEEHHPEPADRHVEAG